ncbi:MAG TPA: type II toxin-antitoxin system VapC family toxin [Bryobacteraceae bacterium]|nr:type II toxin-antitoxin system VapC family toxin [Bryobacteraceae bacterium]
MVIDTSALLTIIFQEPEAERMTTAVVRSPRRSMSAVNWFEALMVIESRLGDASADEAMLILEELDVSPIPFDKQHMHEARSAWRRFGKGRHAAGLNMADCCAYAAAALADEPLLFKGNDFAKTDLRAAEW